MFRAESVMWFVLEAKNKVVLFCELCATCLQLFYLLEMEERRFSALDYTHDSSYIMNRFKGFG